MNILGLDLSLTGTGWCVNTDLELKVGTVDTKKIDGFPRLHKILHEILGLVVEREIECVVMEDFSFASKGRGIFQIGGLGYIVRYFLWNNGMPFYLVAPSQLKKFATGKGNSDKSIIIKEIYRKWGADINDDNQADAYVLSRIGHGVFDVDTKFLSYEQEVISEIKKQRKDP
jgi:crossover junction endodeoxyribonuclease RuvC